MGPMMRCWACSSLVGLVALSSSVSAQDTASTPPAVESEVPSVAPARRRRRVVDVSPAETLARIAGSGAAPSSTAPVDAPPESSVDRAARRVDRGLRAELRADAIRSGRADGYHQELGRAMRAALRIDGAELLADGLESSSVPEIVVDEITRPTARERPIEPRGTPLPDETGGPNDMDPEPIEQIADQENLLNASAIWRRAVVRVHQDRRGRVVRVTLVSSSGRRSIDTAALRAARRARVRRPPRRVMGALDEISSDWAIEVGDVASSPGVLGCTDDGRCAAFGHGLLRIRIELLDVRDAMFEEPEE